MSSPLQNNITNLQNLLETVNALPEAGGVDLPTLTDEGSASDLLANKQLIDQDGNIVTGTMPNNGSIFSTIDGITKKSITIPSGYTSGGTVSLDNTIDNEVDKQANLIAQISAVLEGKASGDNSSAGELKIAYVATHDIAMYSNIVVFNPGMTWNDFCNSEYNIRYSKVGGLPQQTAFLRVYNNAVWDSEDRGYRLSLERGDWVTGSDEIIEGHIYIMHYDD